MPSELARRPVCDRCGSPAVNHGDLPTDEGETYRFCSECWNALHQWVKRGATDE